MADIKETSAIDLILEDHKRVKDLFAKLEENHEDKTVFKDCMNSIQKELVMHTALEGQYLYPKLQEIKDVKVKDGEMDLNAFVLEAFEEHRVAEQQLYDVLDEMDELDLPEVFAKAEVLIEEVKHHIEEEESELLPTAKKILGEEELKVIGRKMQETKEEELKSGKLFKK